MINYDRLWFEQMRGLKEFEHATDWLHPKKSLRANSFKFAREAWVAAKFARSTVGDSTTLRLTSDGAKGDFVMDPGNGEETLYEITEDIDPMIKHLNQKKEGQYRESEQSMSGEMVHVTISKLISKKAAKKYPEGTGLVIYRNYIWPEDYLMPTCEHPFSSIWILDNTKIAHRIFPQV